ncbi:MAG: M14 family zinc carboxypeptidase [Bdellovibrionota bacterium]
MIELMPWDHMLHSILKHIQFVFMPIVNPAGMHQQTRSNSNGIDLMRNAPIDSDIVRWYHIWGGHRVSRYLPWYRGKAGKPMEIEAQALCDVVKKYLLPSKVSLAVDLHSGFGKQDQLWFPYAHTRKPFPYIAQALELKKKLDQAYPFHVYRYEPQSIRYQSHGDLWDYLFYEHEKRAPEHFFMPLTLELGSWAWLKKSPKHIFSSLGIFNPMEEHRRQRTFRRHLVLFDFLTRAVVSHEKWVNLDKNKQQDLYRQALQLWELTDE